MEEKEPCLSIDAGKIGEGGTNEVLPVLGSDVEVNLFCNLVAGQGSRS